MLTTLLQPLLPLQRTSGHVLILGAGIVGLSLALELQARGHRVTVLDTGFALRGASVAAAGMLAADDPHNPAELHDLAHFSLRLYPGYLERLAALSGRVIPFQTDTVVQYVRGGARPPARLAEHSLDPRQLADALLAAVRTRPDVVLLENTGPYEVQESRVGVGVLESGGQRLQADYLVHAQGAWFAQAGAPAGTGGPTGSEVEPLVGPRKGQMLRVAIPEGVDLREVHRRDDVYVVPRTLGPQAGTALLGATVEDAGFDTSTDAGDLACLRALASELVPELADALAAPQIEAWAGLRPSTRDGLPVLGAVSPRQLVASGHFRNGILLAPTTAVVLADVLEGRPQEVNLTPFSPTRFHGP